MTSVNLQFKCFLDIWILRKLSANWDVEREAPLEAPPLFEVIWQLLGTKQYLSVDRIYSWNVSPTALTVYIYLSKHEKKNEKKMFFNFEIA